jgi:hypothetical protein
MLDLRICPPVSPESSFLLGNGALFDQGQVGAVAPAVLDRDDMTSIHGSSGVPLGLGRCHQPSQSGMLP